jgi:hypothetical protein
MPITPGKTMARRKRSEHYVNNKEFLAALIKYREDKEIAEIKGLPKPVIPRYIGECFLNSGKGDNPEKSQNPFAYFTQIIHYAFLRRIQREKRQLEIKNKILEKSGYSEVFDDSNKIDGDNYSDYNQIKDAVHSKLRN